MRFLLLSLRVAAFLCAILLVLFGSDHSHALPAPQPEQAKNEIPPRVAIIYGSAATCTDTCPSWIAIEGKLTEQTETAFRAIIKKLGKTRLPVLVHSGGGLVHVGFAIGRIIRANHLDVGVARTEIIGCDPARITCPPGTADTLHGEPHSLNAFCASACTFILAGGNHRYAAPWAHVGVHQITDIQKLVTRHFTMRVTKFVSPETQEVTEKKTVVSKHDDVQMITHDTPTHASLAEIRAYLKEMGIDLQLQALMALTDPKAIHLMTHMEQDETGLVTDFYGAETLIARSDLPASVDLIGPQLPIPTMQRPEVAGPEMPVTRIANGLLRVPWVKGQNGLMSVEFIHRRFSPVVEFDAVLENRAELRNDGKFGLAMTFGGLTNYSGKKALATIVAESWVPAHPMKASIPNEIFCDMRFENKIRLRFAELSPERKIADSVGAFDGQGLTGMQQLVDEVCPKTQVSASPSALPPSTDARDPW